jgi:hypothetical protein
MKSAPLPTSPGWHDLDLIVDAAPLRCTLVLPAQPDGALLVLALP